MPCHRTYGDAARLILASLQRRRLLDQEAFALFVGEATGKEVRGSLVSQWCTGEAHLPADVLPLLADFTGAPELVLGPIARACGLKVSPIDEESSEADRTPIELLGRQALTPTAALIAGLLKALDDGLIDEEEAALLEPVLEEAHMALRKLRRRQSVRAVRQ